MRKILWMATLAMSCVLFWGCASQDLAQSTDPVCLPNTPTEQAMNSAQTVLEKMHFDIAKNDSSVGYIRTRPLSGAQFFEFWRKDNASAFARGQSNLHSIRRVVELEFSPQDTTTCIQCRVQVSRLSVPERPISGFANMGGLYTDSHNRKQTLDVGGEQLHGIEWIDEGPDRELERKVLKLIQQDIQKGTSR